MRDDNGKISPLNNAIAGMGGGGAGVYGKGESQMEIGCQKYKTTMCYMDEEMDSVHKVNMNPFRFR